MKKRLMMIGMVMMLVFGTCMTSYASSAASTPAVTFTGDAKEYFQFAGNTDDFAQEFKGMLPGEPRTQQFVLSNKDQREMKFYIQTDVAKDLSEDNQAKNAVYDIVFEAGGETIYQGTIGGENGGLTDLSDGAMGGRILLATLKKGETQTVNMTISADGTAMGNDYQNSEAEILFQFSVQYDEIPTPEPTVVRKVVQKVGETTVQVVDVIKQTTQQVMAGVHTGDPTSIAAMAAAMAACAAVIVFIVVKRRKKTEEKS